MNQRAALLWMVAVALLIAIAGRDCAHAASFQATRHDATAFTPLQQNVGGRLPASLPLRAPDGSSLNLAQLLSPGRPLVILPAYFRCQTLCGVAAQRLIEALADTGLPATRWRLAIISMDPIDRPGDAQRLSGVYRNYATQWRPTVYRDAPDAFGLYVSDAGALARLGKAIGWTLQATPDPARSGAPFVHPSAAIIVTPQGRISQYLTGIDFDSAALADALREAAGDRLGAVVAAVGVFCSRLDPTRGSRDGSVLVIVRAVLMGLMVATIAAIAWRRLRLRLRLRLCLRASLRRPSGTRT